MKVTFLGTSSGVPTKQRNVSSIALTLPQIGDVFLFDCGEGTQHQLYKSDLKMGKIRHIFLTHLHGDHCFGLPGMLCSMSGNNPPDREEIHIFGPIGTRAFLRASLGYSESNLGFMLHFHEFLQPNDTNEERKDNFPALPCEGTHEYLKVNEKQVYDCGTISTMRVQCAPIDHRVFCVGYVIQQPDKEGSLDMKKLMKTFKVKPGPWCRDLKAGKPVTLEDGRVIKPEDALGDPTPGLKVCIMGDTANGRGGLNQIAEGCDFMTHESTLKSSQKEMAIERGHSTPTMAAEFAKELKVKHLILTHFSARFYRSKIDVPENDLEAFTLDDLVDEAKHIFGDNVHLAEDFKSFEITLKKRNTIMTTMHKPT